MIAYGYRYGEVPLPRLEPVKKGTWIRLHCSEQDLEFRPAVSGSLGAHFDGALMPHPDPHDMWTTIAGVWKRFTFNPPDPDPVWRAEFRTFVKKWLKKNLVPIAPDRDTSVEHWLSQTSYSAARKAELLTKWQAVQSIKDPEKRYLACKSFMKDEFYPAYKHARAINSRSDEFKAFSGPIFKLIEEALYALPQFIKHVPVADRPRYILHYLSEVTGEELEASDYTAFESLFTKSLMEDCEFQLYKYMTERLPTGPAWYEVVSEALGGTNLCRFKHFTCSTPATRMSGDMCTSLGNGFTNLMIYLFLVQKIGGSQPRVVVEGDDGLGRHKGPRLTSDHYAKLGMVVKLEHHRKIETASFCGIIFDSVDLINVTDPRECLATIGWCTRQYVNARSSKKKALLRCKALSYAHQYPGCPIIQSCALWLLRATRGYEQAARDIVLRQKYYNTWEKDQLMAAFRDEKKLAPKTPGYGTRFLVEDLYGLTVETQLQAEAYFDSLDQIQPIDLPQVLWTMPQAWQDYYRTYVRGHESTADMYQIEHPAGIATRLKGHSIGK